MGQHTPGPWACNVWMVGNNVPTGEITISGPEGDEHICTMDGNEDNLANGNLIAAAPAMYEALKAIAGQQSPNRWGYDSAEIALDDEWRAQARAAIAQAVGKG